jgi:hypothetical protein
MNGSTTRRKFFGSAALLAAPLTAGTAVASDDLAARLVALEDANAIRALLRDWARGVAGKGARSAANVYGFTLDPDVSITVADNGTAMASVPCVVETATPIDGNETLVQMARLQGDGVVRRTERRVLHGSFVKREGRWHLATTELRA